jgi:hypothetical protein
MTVATGIEPAIREYFRQPPSTAAVEKLIELVGGQAKDLIRDGEPMPALLG